MSKDFVVPFMTRNHEANGKIIYLEDSISEIIEKHRYSQQVSHLLAELMVITIYLGQNLKTNRIITSQIQTNEGQLRLLACEYTYGGNIRGYASVKDKSAANDNYNFDDLVKNGHLIVTHDLDNERYQGIIELRNGSLSDSFREYLKQSEQIDAEFMIFTDTENNKYKAAGMIIKKLPAKNKKHENEIDENWEKFSVFVKSLKKDEMINLDHEDILNMLFHEDGVILYDKQKISFKCRCSRDKMENVIKSIDAKEKDSLKVDGKIVIKCQFCGNEEFFD